MLEYQGSSIVSRVLFKEKSGTITLFAFDKGQELSEHTAPFNVVVPILEGVAQISTDMQPYGFISVRIDHSRTHRDFLHVDQFRSNICVVSYKNTSVPAMLGLFGLTPLKVQVRLLKGKNNINSLQSDASSRLYSFSPALADGLCPA